VAVLIRRLYRIGILLFLTAGFSLQANATDEGLELQEQAIKAGLLYNFLKYTDWPVLPSAMTVCIFGEDPFEGHLQPIVGRTVNQREITLRMVHTVNDTQNCQLLYINAAEKQNWPELRKHLTGRSILTVSDFGDFLGSGGMLEFGRKNDHISVELNTEALSAAHLNVQDRLLKLVTIVHPALPEEGR